MIATFNRFEIEMTKAQARSASHQGACDDDVAELLKNRRIARQIEKLDQAKVRDELAEYGAWDDDELADEKANARRIVWLAAGNIVEGM